jgi:hypothetical protein
MKTIWKYPISLYGPTELTMPANSHVVHFAVQNDELVIWAEVALGVLPQETRTFRVVGTGHVAPLPYAEYVGTVQVGPMVWHLYETTVWI